MIIGSDIPLAIGYGTGTVTDKERQSHRGIRMLIIREATFEEWYQRQLENGVKLTVKEIAYAKAGRYFYEVSID